MNGTISISAELLLTTSLKELIWYVLIHDFFIHIYQGFGIAAGGVTGWTITGNTVAAGTQFSGVPNNCPVVNPAPQAFLRTAASSGTFQSGFVVANLKNLICNIAGTPSIASVFSNSHIFRRHI